MKLTTGLSEIQDLFDFITEDLDNEMTIHLVSLLNAAYHIGKADEAFELAEKLGARP